MALTNEQREKIVKTLTANCECWQGEEELLSSFSDDKLDTLMKQGASVQIANAALRGFQDADGNSYRYDPEARNWEGVKNEKGKCMDEGEEDEDETQKENMKRMYQKNEATDPEEWIKANGQELPAAVRNMVETARQVTQREKDKLIEQLLTNVSDADKPRHRDRLLRRSVEDLQEDVAMQPSAGNEQKAEEPVAALGQIPTSNAEDEALPLPKMNWKPQAKATASGAGTPAVNEAVRTDADWMKLAPKNIRDMLSEASEVTGRHKRGLIEQITANMEDNLAKKRYATKLMKESIEDLEDMLQALNPKAARKPDYSGQAVTNVTSRGATDREDILPLPRLVYKDQSKRAAQ